MKETDQNSISGAALKCYSVRKISIISPIPKQNPQKYYEY